MPLRVEKGDIFERSEVPPGKEKVLGQKSITELQLGGDQGDGGEQAVGNQQRKEKSKGQIPKVGWPGATKTKKCNGINKWY